MLIYITINRVRLCVVNKVCSSYTTRTKKKHAIQSHLAILETGRCTAIKLGEVINTCNTDNNNLVNIVVLVTMFTVLMFIWILDKYTYIYHFS